MKTDILIVGSGVAGLYCALNLPKEKQVIIATKNKARRSDSYLAQGGICVLRDKQDYDSFYEDTMKAGHYENNPDSVHTISILTVENYFGIIVKNLENSLEYVKTSYYTILFADDVHLTSLIDRHYGIRGYILTCNIFSESHQNQLISVHSHRYIIHGYFSLSQSPQ